MKSVIFHSEAERDLYQGIAYYEKQRKGLGLELRQEVEALVRRICSHPEEFPLHEEPGTRKGLVRRFPYTIFFLELDEVIWVAAVAHQKRKPHYWSGRYPE